MHKFMSTACSVGLAAALLSGCGGSSDDSLVIYNSFGAEQTRPLINAFKERNPDVQVKLFDQPGETLLGRLSLELESGQPKADIVGLSEALLLGLHEERNALAKYRPNGAKNLVEEAKQHGGIMTPAYLNPYIIHYNTNSISRDEAPRSWADLLDKKWRHKISIANPNSSQTIHTFLWFMFEHMAKKGPPYGKEYCERLKPLAVNVEDSHGTIRDLVVSGERPIAVQVLANAQLAARADEPTAFVWPTEGSPTELGAFAMLKNASHAASAKKFLDFLVSPEAQRLVPDSLGGMPIRDDIEYAFPDGKTSEDVKLLQADARYVSKSRDKQANTFDSALGR